MGNTEFYELTGKGQLLVFASFYLSSYFSVEHNICLFLHPMKTLILDLSYDVFNVHMSHEIQCLCLRVLGCLVDVLND